MAAATPSRTDEIRLIWTENQWLYLVAGFIGGILFCLLVQLSINNLSELVISLLPEAAGILITITVIDVLNRRRDERNAVKQLQEQLVFDASSTTNDVAKNAMHQLRKRGWLKDDKGLLAGADLSLAKLQGTDLLGVNLKGAYLWGTDLRDAFLAGADLAEANLLVANLQRADLSHANMRASDLRWAKLQNARLHGAKLERAKLEGAKLKNAILLWTHLQGANLKDANLKNANFGQGDEAAIFDETTILPDGTHWTSDTDLTKFTHPKTDAPSE